MTDIVRDDLSPREQLIWLWAELESRGAKVRRIPLNAHPDQIAAKIAAEARRLRAIGERPGS